MPGNDSFTKLLLHCNNVDGSTIFIDASASSHSVTANGSSQIDITESKFGGSSVLFDGTTTSRLTIPDSDDWNFGSGDFTIDFWIKFNSLSGFQELVSQWGGGGSNGSLTIIKFNTNNLKVFYSTDGSSEVQVNSTFTFSDTNFHHIALVRDGNTLRFFVDGVAEGTDDWTGVTLFNSTRPLNISTSADGGSNPVDGWIDEVRISKGIARFTTAFTPPTDQYFNSQDDFTLLGISSAQSSFDASQSAEKAVDDNLSTQWAAGNGSGVPVFWQMDYGVNGERTITSYSMQSRNDSFFGTIPDAWTLEGSNTGAFSGEEVILDSRSGIVWVQNERKEFTVTDPDSFRFYRINISSIQTPPPANNTSILEIEMFASIAVESASENLEITDSIEVTDTTVTESENLQIADSIEVTDTTVLESESLQISDSIIVTDTNIDAKFISKIISINPLIFITDTNPVEIIKVDTTDPSNITWIVQTISGITSAKDVAVNTSNNFIYIAGNTGQVIKVEIADLTNQTIIDVNDVDDLITIETNSNFGITYAGTENIIGELYVIDERDTFKIDSDFQVIAPIEFLMDSDFNVINSFKMDSDFQVLAQQTFLVNTDFKCITKPVVTPPPTVNPLDVIEPIKLTDFQVFVNAVELEDTDLILNSITITHSQSEQSRASFRLSRKHDQLNTTLKGVSSQITNQNTVEIKIRGITEFNGNISELDCQYNNNGEFVQVNALAPEKLNQFNNITLSLPGLDSRLSLYDILIENPKIFNPVTDEDDDSPKKFKGIRVNLGQIIKQIVIKKTVDDSFGLIANAIQDGGFISIQNWTYFWGTIRASNFGDVKIGDSIAQDFFYIGTSLAPVSEELWNLTKASHHRQRIYSDEKIKLGDGNVAVSDFNGLVSNPTDVHLQLQNKGFLIGGGGSITDKFKETTDSSELELTGITGNEQSAVYQEIEKQLGFTVGEAPFQDISVRNGILQTKPKLVDEPDRLSNIKEAGNNFVEFAKEVARLEFEKLKNINGNILPDTSCTFNLTVDAYYYYGISLLTKINVDNTTDANIYNNANGFPVSTKSITITSSDRKVTIDANNIKSTKELEEIDGQFPSEDDDEYNEKERRILIALKENMRTRLRVE